MADDDNKQMRFMPENTLDYNMMMIESEWGRDESINAALLDKLQKIKGFYVDKDNNPIIDEAGNPEFVKESLWGMLGFYTRDMRLSNLDASQFRYSVFYLDLCNDFLRVDMIEPFLTCLSRVATVLELSQSRGGFLRNRQNTLTTETRFNLAEQQKRSILTGKQTEAKM
jgi:hypothetical protein